MSRHNFCHLVAAVAPFMSPCENYVRTPVPLDKRVAMALYKVASCGEYRIVANQFGMHKSTVKKFFYMFCQSVTTHLAKEYVKLPSANEAKKKLLNGLRQSATYLKFLERLTVLTYQSPHQRPATETS